MVAIFNGAVDAVVVIDTGGIVRFANPACRRLFGREPADLVDRSVNALMPLPHRERHDEYLRAYLQSGEPKIIGIGREVEALHASGEVIPVHLSVSEVFVKDTRLFAGFFRNMSASRREQAEIRDRKARMSAVLEAAVDAIITIDERGRIESVNPAFERMFGYSAEETLGKNVNVLMPEPWQSEHDEYIHHYLRTGERRIIGIGREVAARHKNGRVFPIDLSVGEVTLDDGRRIFTGIVRDISDRRKLLERLVEKESLSRLGEMATVMAHEVRNPLAGISGALQILGRRFGRKSEEHEVVDAILDRIRVLEGTVSEILHYARPRPPRRAAVPARMLVESAVEMTAADPRFHGIEVSISGPDMMLYCDAEQIQAVFLNLAVNAAHAIGGKGRLEIELDSAEDGGGVPRGRVIFRDTGPGVPEDIRERIFEAFFTNRSGGTGLGLSIARHTLEAHQGAIRVGTAPGGGAEFTVEVPLATKP